MFYSQVILAKKGPLAKVWLAAHWGDKKLARPQIFATDISQSCTDIMNPSVPLALRLSGHLLLGVVRIYSRKVKYVLNDCTEAMLKLQMAFHPSKAVPLDANGNPTTAPGGRELLTEADAPSHQLVTNFGEFDQVHVVEGFCLPLPEDNEWILADDDDDDEETEAGSSTRGPNRHQGLLLNPAHLPTHTQQSNRSPGPFGMNLEDDDEEEEAWAPFDPDQDDDENELAEGLPGNSRVSDIEIVRAANDSLLSEDQTRRSTSLLDKSALTENTAGNPNPDANNAEEEDYDFNVPFADSEDEEGLPSTPGGAGTGTNLDDSALQLSKEGGTPLGASAGLGLGLDEEEEPTTTTTTEQQAKPAPRKRRRKRRKVVIDNHETELTNDHIRAMLSDTHDLVMPMIHPASIWDEDGDGLGGNTKDYQTLVREERLQQQLESNRRKTKPAEAVPSLTQPFLMDHGKHPNPALHPRLQQLWQDNYWKPLGHACPYKRQQETVQEPADDVEHVRRDRADDDESSKGDSVLSDLRVTKDDDADKKQEPLAEEDEMDFPTALDDDDDDEEEDLEAPPVDLDSDEDQEDATGLKRKRTDANDNDDDLLDLGMVNDMVLDSDDEHAGDAEDEDRQALGDEHSSSTKWHKHTVRVFQHLKKCLRDPSKEDDAEQDEADDSSQPQPLPDAVTFSELTKHVVTRRNASSIFFEMLQLKTWDFIELDQDESYGNIAISAGVRFGEDAPEK